MTAIPSKYYLRINTLKAERDAIIRSMIANGLNAEAHMHLSDAAFLHPPGIYGRNRWRYCGSEQVRSGSCSTRRTSLRSRSKTMPWTATGHEGNCGRRERKSCRVRGLPPERDEHPDVPTRGRSGDQDQQNGLAEHYGNPVVFEWTDPPPVATRYFDEPHSGSETGGDYCRPQLRARRQDEPYQPSNSESGSGYRIRPQHRKNRE